jgi:hypothetical protein
LDYLNHSSIDMDTLRTSLFGLPDEFLEGFGMELGEIELLRSMWGTGHRA